MYPHRTVEKILQDEELRRIKRNHLIRIEESTITKYDIKGEVFKIRETLPVLLRAINISDSEEVKRLCNLINRRVNNVCNYYKNEP